MDLPLKRTQVRAEPAPVVAEPSPEPPRPAIMYPNRPLPPPPPPPVFASHQSSSAPPSTTSSSKSSLRSLQKPLPDGYVPPPASSSDSITTHHASPNMVADEETEEDLPFNEDEDESPIERRNALASQRLKSEALIEEQFTKKRTSESIEQEYAQQSETGVKELFNPANIDMKSELNNKEVIAATRLLFMGERYEIPAFGHFVTNFLRLKVSTNRKGRREYIEGLHAEEKKEQGKDLSPLMALMSNLGGQQ